MGQMTHAVILGVDAGEPPEYPEDGWSSFLEDYKAGKGPTPDTPSGDADNYNVVGFWVAVGGSGEDGVPDLDKGFQLDAFLEVPTYRKSHAKALKAWEKFAKWAATKKGHKFGEPRLWLVQTEVA